MKCPICNYEFYTLRNAVKEDTGDNFDDLVSSGKIAKKLWLNCPECNNDFFSWIHFDYNPETSESFDPIEELPDEPCFR